MDSRTIVVVALLPPPAAEARDDGRLLLLPLIIAFGRGAGHTAATQLPQQPQLAYAYQRMAPRHALTTRVPVVNVGGSGPLLLAFYGGQSKTVLACLVGF